MLQNCVDGRDECVTAAAQLTQPLVDNLLQGALSAGEQDDTDLPQVAITPDAAHIAMRFHAIDQTNGAVVTESQAFRQSSDAGFVWVRECPNRKKHLVLLRFKASAFRSLIAAPKKLADAIAQFGQCSVFRIVDLSFHVLIISQYDIHASQKFQCLITRPPNLLRMHPLNVRLLSAK